MAAMAAQEAVESCASSVHLRVSIDGRCIHDSAVELSSASECSVSFRGGPKQRAVELVPQTCIELVLDDGRGEAVRCFVHVAAEDEWTDLFDRPGFLVRTWADDIATGAALYTVVVDVLHVRGTDVVLLHAVRLVRQSYGPHAVVCGPAASPGPCADRYVARGRLCTRAWDACVPPAARAALRGDVAHLLRHHRCAPGRNTRWVPAIGPPPRCTIERLARAVFDLHAADLLAGLGADERERALASSGAEWWVQFRSSADEPDAQSIRFHFDRDEELAQRHGVDRNPFASTVTYLTDAGAPTLLLPLYDRDGRSGEGGLARAAGDDGAVLSYPAAGKHLVFDGRLLHGCPAQLSRAPEAVAGAAWERLSVLVNVWIGHRPLAAASMSDALAAELSDLRTEEVLDMGTGVPSPVCDLEYSAGAAEWTEEVDAVPGDLRPREWWGARVSVSTPSAEPLAARAHACAPHCSTLRLLEAPLQVLAVP